MSNVLVDENALTNIANSIRSKNGTTTTYKPAEMSAAIDAISTSSGSGELVSSSLVLDGSSVIMSQNFVDNATYILYTFNEEYELTNQVGFQIQNDSAQGSFNLDSETIVTYMAFIEFFGSGSDLFDVFSLSFEGTSIPAFVCLKKTS